jgi:hypothetical protein
MVYLELGKLNLHKGNPRKISHRELEKLCESIRGNPEYFEARPIICDSEYTIYAGNSRYKAAKKLGLQKVPVHVMNLPESKMREIMIRDNVNNGEWDANILSDEWQIEDLTDFGLELKGNWGESDETDDGDSQGESKSREKKTKMRNF